jgi:hypothetical protein
VPAARAAELTANDANSSLRCTTPALDADVVSQGLADGTCYVLAGKTVTINVDVDDGSDTTGDTFAAGATVNAPVGGEAPQPMRKGGKVSSASKRADGCAIRGKTRAR